MTRVNVVPIEELYDQHLFAEWRELRMVPSSLRRSLISRGEKGVLEMVPDKYCLGKGHVSFFYDKGEFLRKRYEALTKELLARSYSIDPTEPLDKDGIYASLPKEFQKDYEPDIDALSLNRERISSRIALRPGWYRHKGRKITAP